MKNIQYNILLALLLPVVLMSCLKEDIVLEPTVQSVTMYMTDVAGNDSLITQPTVNQPFRFVIETDADIATVWPGGERRIMKKKNSDTDSLDMFGHPVLIVSDHYADYGLVKARGFKTALGERGWYCSYTYDSVGDFDLTVVVTNHGYQSNNYQQLVYQPGKVTVTE